MFSILRRLQWLRLLVLFLALALPWPAWGQHEHGHAGNGFLLFSVGSEQQYPVAPNALYTLDQQTGQRTVWNKQLPYYLSWDQGLTYDYERDLLWGNGYSGTEGGGGYTWGVVGFNPYTGESRFVAAKPAGAGIAFDHVTKNLYRIVFHQASTAADYIPFLEVLNPDSGDEEELFQLGLPEDNLNIGVITGFGFFADLARTLVFEPKANVLYAGYNGDDSGGLIVHVDFKEQAADETLFRGPRTNTGLSFHPVSGLLYGLESDDGISLLVGVHFPPGVPLPHGTREADEPAFCGGQQLGIAFAPLLGGRED